MPQKCLLCIKMGVGSGDPNLVLYDSLSYVDWKCFKSFSWGLLVDGVGGPTNFIVTPNSNFSWAAIHSQGNLVNLVRLPALLYRMTSARFFLLVT